MPNIEHQPAQSHSDRYELYRKSFTKTTWVAAAASAACLAAVVHMGLYFRNLALIGVALLLFAACLTVCAAGLLVLHRHRRELSGRPDLFWQLLQRLERDPPRGWLRCIIAPRLRAGTRVCVRSVDEILTRLDERSETDGIPFMPEMLPCCGREFYVHRVIDKINDWSGRTGTGLRRLQRFVTLRNVRCDGLLTEAARRTARFSGTRVG